MPEQLHVHIPWGRLESSLPMLLTRRLQPEIAFSGPDLDSLDSGKLAAIGAQLAAANLAVSVHAPFHDLNPGALEPLVQEATRKRLRQSISAAAALGGRVLVCHPGYEFWKYGGRDHLWLEQSLLFWPRLIELAAESGIVVALENIFETRPHTLLDLLTELDTPWLGHCFDVGHWRLFGGTPMDEWFASLGPHLVHLHLHDNRGDRDDHLPVGEGDIDFALLAELVGKLPQRPSMTLEAHSEEALLRSLEGVRSIFP